MTARANLTRLPRRRSAAASCKPFSFESDPLVIQHDQLTLIVQCSIDFPTFCSKYSSSSSSGLQPWTDDKDSDDCSSVQLK